MMNSMIEVRSPFLARRVVQGALGLPRDMRTGKKILREMFADELPEDVIYQKKKPLRIAEVENNREARSVRLCMQFRNMFWTL